MSFEDTVLRRARVRVSLLVGLTITALLALGATISYVTLLHSQHEQIERELDLRRGPRHDRRAAGLQLDHPV